ncbi:Polyisoprenyl-teichoic acid--peptidoglycan teichoic acid transferase TagU [subsurface metagenome]
MAKEEKPNFSNKKIRVDKEEISEQELNKEIRPIKKSKIKKIALWTSGILVVFLIAWFLAGAAASIFKIFTKNYTTGSPFLSFLSKVNPTQLKGEGDGRINILLLGMPGSSYPGPELTDTIIVLSIDPKNNTAAMLSIPRDLYVKPSGFYSYTKINSVYTLAEQQANSTQKTEKKSLFKIYSEKPENGFSEMKETVADILDLPIHYYIKMDFDGFVKIIDELGGIDIYVEKNIYDPYYPNERYGYKTFKISKGTHHLDGQTALKYARSRETTSDFDRAKRQQQILVAIKEKALQISFFDIKSISNLIKIIGDHFRTDLTFKEIERLIEIVKDVKADTVITKVLDSSLKGGLVSSRINGMFILKPRAGLGNYKDIQAIAHNIFTDPYLVEENAKIEVQNGTNKTGLAGKTAQFLKNYNYNVVKTSTAKTKYSETQIIDYTLGHKPFTIKFLQSRISGKVIQQNPPAGSTVDIVIILGHDFQGI